MVYNTLTRIITCVDTDIVKLCYAANNEVKLLEHAKKTITQQHNNNNNNNKNNNNVTVLSPKANKTRHRFYHMMHCSAKRDLAIACHPSSVTVVDQDHVGWKSW